MRNVDVPGLNYTPAATAPVTPPAPEPEPRDKTVIVQVEKDSRLEALLTTYEAVKDRRDEADEAYDQLTSAVLAELKALYPAGDIKVYDIPGCRMWPPLAYGYQRSAYLPGPKIREFLPAVWDSFHDFKESWVLRRTGKRR